METVFSVTAAIEINGKRICHTWKSEFNYDDCHRQIEQYIKDNSVKGDKVVTEIINTAMHQYRCAY